ncbi:MAG: 1-(5-phosphoribosyl)-5-((5-phosphoribosylamino)methylideneamino) imidazole-4-carboxamide isomerase [candidate division TA06 bacterium ADurb.Bin417]|uniref:1-(5-phosphoribosyl)-5-[(5-phosphoribosylamino)methylideneamino] imidazole-4-carboxamide isomerase n=1 Tax=candidate division TA06 bacterium ADurb.Bin417 TaxID=1852828 RepID=A0A1V5MI06_UNCT6|nr:MAG: 1-(5-phosphoribosyl)-5-((5-phosphoribosylamino)methylideneamino) imidazole-4-carboxamide isomerase [candidate division TA06 bacterium ADurb.Bin417]
MLIIPAIDILDGRLVRLSQGDYDRVSDYRLDPVRIFEDYLAAGVRRLHLVFLSAARDGSQSPDEEALLGRLLAVRPAGVELEVGGGIRRWETAERLLSLGVDYLILGTAAVLDIIRLEEERQKAAYEGGLAGFVRQLDFKVTSILQDILERRSAGRFIISLDVRSGAAAVSGWEMTLPPAVDRLAGWFSQLGFTRLIHTAVERDGTLAGPDLEALKSLSGSVPGVSLIAAGGIGSESDIAALAALKLPNLGGVIVGKALYEGRVDLGRLIRTYQSGS